MVRAVSRGITAVYIYTNVLLTVITTKNREEMGIFSREERIHGPQVSFGLDEQCQGPLFPGHRLSGEVTIHSPIPRHIQSAVVVFSGTATTHAVRWVNRGAASAAASNRRRILYHDEAGLCSIDQHLLGQAQVHPGAPVVSRFSFIIPGSTANVVGPVPYTDGRTTEHAYATAGHILPPTLSHVLEGFSDDQFATIEYVLQVVINFEPGSGPFYSQPLPLVFCPLRSPAPVQNLESVRPAERYQSSRLTGEAKSFRNSFRDKFSNETPSVDVVLRARISSSIPTGSSFAIQTCAEISSLSVPNISVPTIDLRIAKLEILPITFFRALLVSEFSMDRPEHEVVDEESLTLNATPSSRTVEAQALGEGSMIVFPATFEARIPGNIPPSLRTFTINRNYSLKMTLEADIAGKTFEHKFQATVVVDSSVSA